MHCDDTGMVATGIPPMQVFMYEQSLHYAGQVVHNESAIEALEENRYSAPVELLIQKIGTLEEIITARIEMIPLPSASIVQTSRTTSFATSASCVQQPQSEESNLQHTLYCNSDQQKYTRVPDKYKFEWQVTLRTIYDLFYEGHPNLLMIPYRHLKPHDLGALDRNPLSRAKHMVA